MMKSKSLCVILDNYINCKHRAVGSFVIGKKTTIGQKDVVVKNLAKSYSQYTNYKSNSYTHRKKMTSDSKFITIGDYAIYPWSLSGIESSVVVKGPGPKERVVFDMGYAHREAVRCADVFIRQGSHNISLCM